ncbi:MAG: hypothetical protein M3O62_06815 [Pseudomonadota bacterium]|nr:hypothetical protein [Pseudomonadota bacterium]
MKSWKKLVAAILGLAVVSGVQAAEFKKDSDCVPGNKVADRSNKVGTVVSVDNGMCKVVFADGTSSSYLFWMLRAAGDKGQTTDKLVAGNYPCYSGSNYLFMDVEIVDDDSYRTAKGKGDYSLEKDGSIDFEDGPLEDATAKLMPGPRIGLNMDGGSFFNVSCSLKKK